MQNLFGNYSSSTLMHLRAEFDKFRIIHKFVLIELFEEYESIKLGDNKTIVLHLNCF